MRSSWKTLIICCGPRAEGNETLRRFLTIADGVVRAQGRKIVFSTNLPNVGDLDDALIRPGRCFAHIITRDLTGEEGAALARKIVGIVGSSTTDNHFDSAKRYPVAEVYRRARKPLENER